RDVQRVIVDRRSSAVAVLSSSSLHGTESVITDEVFQSGGAPGALSGRQLVSTISAPAKSNVPTTSSTDVGVAQRVQFASRKGTTTAVALIEAVGHSAAARDSTICACVGSPARPCGVK